MYVKKQRSQDFGSKERLAKINSFDLRLHFSNFQNQAGRGVPRARSREEKVSSAESTDIQAQDLPAHGSFHAGRTGQLDMRLRTLADPSRDSIDR